ncbi:hypothetical protein RD00_20170 [Pseudomonas amygdali pv. tabaci]|nr:hypothetical protein RD00_20170 [Pseudomonas amygdali pv. tabaci]
MLARPVPQPPTIGDVPAGLDLQRIVTEALMGMIAAVTSTSPPANEPPPPFIQAGIDRAVSRISAHLAPLQAETERLAYELNCSKGLANLTKGNSDEAKEEIDQLKAQRDELEKNDRRYEWIRSQGTKWSELSPALLERVNDECNPPYMALKFGEELDSAIDACISRADLSKPAGSDQ